MSSFPSTDPSAPAPGAACDAEVESAATFAVGTSVQLAERPPYLKSADPMPMLRPPDLIDVSETGVVVEVRTQQLRAVRFRRGTFLLSASQLRQAETA